MREKIFWNLMAKSYSKGSIKNIDGYTHSLKVVKKYLNKKQKVLEIGCGSGSTAVKLARYVKEYEGMDISDKLISIANQKVRNQDLKNIKFFESTLYDKSLKENSYEVIMAYNVIHLLNDREKATKRINKLLKKDGLYISKTPCLGESKLITVLTKIVQFAIGPIRSFTIKENRESIEKNGFKIEFEHIYKEDNPDRSLVIAKKK